MRLSIPGTSSIPRLLATVAALAAPMLVKGTTSWACLADLEYWENAHWNNLRRTCEAGGCPAASGHQVNGCGYYHNGVQRGATCDAMARTSNACTLRGCDGQNCNQGELRAQATRTTTRSFTARNFDDCKAACLAVTNSYWHGVYINQCQAGCALAHCETTAPSSDPCVYGATTTARPPTSPAPSTAQPTTDVPTSALPTSIPSAGPTERPIVNTVSDCGIHHANCIQETGPLPLDSARCSSRIPGDTSATCICAGRYHCSHPSARRGRCAFGDYCLEQGETASPSVSPTVTPTDQPSTSPTMAPSPAPSGAPSGQPSRSPSTATPTSSPSGYYQYDRFGYPILPTDEAGQEYLVLDSQGRPVVPRDPYWGQPVTPEVISTRTSITSTSGRPPVNNPNASQDSNGGSSNSTVLVVVIVAVVLVVVIAAGAYMLVRKWHSQQSDNGNKAFSNPAYELSGSANVFGERQVADEKLGTAPTPDNAYATVQNFGLAGSGYMDVAPNPGLVTSGYMDVASVPDDLEEDV